VICAAASLALAAGRISGDSGAVSAPSFLFCILFLLKEGGNTPPDIDSRLGIEPRTPAHVVHDSSMR
jgi:hypothetical protein